MIIFRRIEASTAGAANRQRRSHLYVKQEHDMSDSVNDQALDLIFRQARTHNAWVNKPVDDALLRRVYDLAKMGPTSANMCPMRIVFVKSKEAKEKLKPDRKST